MHSGAVPKLGLGDQAGHYLNRRDQEKRDFVAVFGALADALTPLRELACDLCSPLQND
jgi:hypothetical protein